MQQRAVVTGANSGIGLATALRLAADGYEVWAGARSDNGLAAIEEAAGSHLVRPVRLDVTDDDSVSDAFATVLGAGPVDVLVNNAGITGAGSVEETPVDVYQSMFDTNVLGTVRCTQQVLPGMRESRGGYVVNMSSSSALLSPPLMAPYASTKRAVESISESLQSEVAEYGVRVVLIEAGTILTPIWGKSETPPEDTAYPRARDLLLTVLMHNLTTSGVPAETVAEAIAESVADPVPPFRRLVGDADVLAGMRSRHTDEEVLGVFFLEADELRTRYAELAGVDYWG